jgi:hypothetical protein
MALQEIPEQQEQLVLMEALVILVLMEALEQQELKESPVLLVLLELVVL